MLLSLMTMPMYIVMSNNEKLMKDLLAVCPCTKIKSVS